MTSSLYLFETVETQVYIHPVRRTTVQWVNSRSGRMVERSAGLWKDWVGIVGMVFNLLSVTMFDEDSRCSIVG